MYCFWQFKLYNYKLVPSQNHGTVIIFFINNGIRQQKHIELNQF